MLALLSLFCGAGVGAAEVQVDLFGQPCLLRGPQAYDEATLKKIHDLSPAELEPVGSGAAGRKFLDRIKAAALPSALDSYREKEIHKLEAQISFFDALEAAGSPQARKSGKAIETLVALGKKQLSSAKAQKRFLALAHKPSAKGSSAEMLELLNDAIATEPQEEFHRAIRQMNLEYVCSFDSGEGAGDDSNASE